MIRGGGFGRRHRVVAWRRAGLRVPGDRWAAAQRGRLAGWYVGRLQRRARSDPVLTEALTRVIHFERPPSSLFHPRVMWRVLSPVAGWFGSAEPESNTAGVTVPPNDE